MNLCPKCGKNPFVLKDEIWHCVCGYSISRKEPNCNICKIGQEHLINHFAMKNHDIKKYEFIFREQKLGTKCFSCVFNQVKGLKAKAMKTMNQTFKSCDWYLEIEDDSYVDSATEVFNSEPKL